MRLACILEFVNLACICFWESHLAILFWGANIGFQSENWRASEAVKGDKSKLGFQKVLQYHQFNKADFGSTSIPEVPLKYCIKGQWT